MASRSIQGANTPAAVKYRQPAASAVAIGAPRWHSSRPQRCVPAGQQKQRASAAEPPPAPAAPPRAAGVQLLPPVPDVIGSKRSRSVLVKPTNST